MKLTTTQQAELLEAAKPLIRWLNENGHPHCEARVDQCDVELFEGIALARTEEFVDGRREAVDDVEAKLAKAEAALIGLVGSGDRTELEQMEALMRGMPAPDLDKVNALNAIHYLLSRPIGGGT